jgi:DNA-binding beta-propeller fold protein YncE
MKNISRALGARMGRRALAVLGIMACVAACLVPAGAAAANQPVPSRLLPRVSSRAAEAAIARIDGLNRAALAQPGGVVQASPGGRGASLLLDGSPGIPLANPQTSTVYVPIQCSNPSTPATCTATASHVVDVINAARCNTSTTSGCRVVARATAGKSPFAAALDERTDTLFVVDQFGNTVSVIDGATCNATITSGCGKALATIKTGNFPVGAALNTSTQTLYVANLGGGSVSVINVARCNAVTTAGCGQPARTIKDPLGPDAIAVNAVTDTVYAANSGLTSTPGDTVSVIDGTTCNGSTGTGCGQTPPTITVGANPFLDVVDQATDTVYVVNNGDGTVSVINGATCNATITSGCGQPPPAVTTGAGAGFAGIDQARHTLFTLNGDDNTLSTINTGTCNGMTTAGCPQRAPSQRAAPDHGRFLPFPGAFALIPQLNALYLVNVGGSSTVLSVINPSRCTAISTSGCRIEAPSVPDSEFLLAIDPATDTIYGGNLNLPRIDVINGATCNTSDLSGCAPVATIPMAHPLANMGAGSIDQATHTLYAADPSSDTVAVINTATCNATHTSGCAQAPPLVKVGVNPGPPALNPATHSLYVPFGKVNFFNKVAVINAATCNAANTTGCGQAPGVVTVGKNTFNLAVSVKTDTVYAPSVSGNTIAVINGVACNGTDHSGCGRPAVTAMAGLSPFAVAVDDHTNTVYLTNFADDVPGTVTVINSATCNGTRTGGCHRRFPARAAGRGPDGVAVDPSTGTVYVADFFGAAVTSLNGSGRAGRQQAVGSVPQFVAVNPSTHTVYVTQLFQTGSMSIFSTTGH